MTPPPLPVPTRICGGEDVNSYAHRASKRNHTDVRTVEESLRERGILVSRSRSAPERVHAWRCLGGLHGFTFETPEVIANQKVAIRQLCLRCTKGDFAYGRAPHIGMVCLRHKQWLGEPQSDLRRFPAALAAERHYRNRLVPHAVLFDSTVMLIGRECASVSVGPQEAARRRAMAQLEDSAAALYPETVAFARLLSGSAFLTLATGPRAQDRLLNRLIEREVARIVPDNEDTEPWRAQSRIRYVARRLARQVSEARAREREPDDGYYNLLRLLDCQPGSLRGSVPGTQSKSHRVSRHVLAGAEADRPPRDSPPHSASGGPEDKLAGRADDGKRRTAVVVGRRGGPMGDGRGRHAEGGHADNVPAR